MSRNISADIMAQFRNKELIPVCLFDFVDGTNIFRYTSLDVPFIKTEDGIDTEFTDTLISGMEWIDDSDEYSEWAEYSPLTNIRFEPRGFSFDSIKYSLGNIVDQATITIDNVDRVMTQVFVEGTIQGQDAALYIAVLDSAGSAIGVQNIFKGKIDSCELNEGQARIVISSPFARWAQQTTSLQSSSCRWKIFQGVECQYAGDETWCDRTYKRCQVLENTQHFGGFRHLPDLMQREINWGDPVTGETKG